MIRRTLLTVSFAVMLCGVMPSPSAAQDYRYYADVETGYPETPNVFKHYGPGYYSEEYADPDYRSEQPADSFKYYGPNGLWYQWNESQRRGRDMWLFWTAGNQKFYRRLQVILGDKLDFSVDFFRLLDTRNRGHRFRDLGLINEPNFGQAAQPDRYGLWMDERTVDDGYYPNRYYQDQHDLYKYWGESTGILGLRKFKNPKFTAEMEKRWTKAATQALEDALAKGPIEDLAKNYVASEPVREYFRAPSRVEPPYLVGITCAFCHIAFDPLNTPEDPEKPRWENLAANIGNQYFDEGGLFVGRGRVGGGDLNQAVGYFVDDKPEKGVKDPYRTTGFSSADLLWHYGATQQRGTSETSRFSYDFINNPNTINKIFNVGGRVAFWETTPTGARQPTLHVLKDGADSVGVPMALQRVYVNIGAESRYWIDHLFDPFTGRRQRPLAVDEVQLTVPADRQKELQERYFDEIYGEPFGRDWKFTEARIQDLINYLVSYTPFYLEKANGFKPEYLNRERARRGATVFADTCAECHSSKQPPYYVTAAERKDWFRQSVRRDDFRDGNALTSGVRYPVTFLGLNSQRAMATNAIDGDIWAELSSKEYKAQPPVGRMKLTIPISRDVMVDVEYTPPGGGRGYYRPASLVSLWATAPFLHNNSLGKQPLRKATAGDITEANPYLVQVDDTITDGRAVTVAGRLELFDDACRQLLWPERRFPDIKRTSADSRLVPPEVLKRALNRTIADIATELITGYAKTLLIDNDVAEDGADAIVDALRPKIRDKIWETLVSLKDPQKTEQILGILEQAVATIGKDQQIPVATLAKVVDKVEPYAQNVLQAANTDIPAGTPINLLLNQDINSLPYVVLAMIKYKKDPAKLAEALLAISECPDIVENRGHYFGTQWDPRGDSYSLDNDQKKDLIEFLKTL